MLSEQFINACESIEEASVTARDLIERETNEAYGLCHMGYIQLWANPDHKHDLKELEQLVGPIKYAYTVESGSAYTFALGKAHGLIIMPTGTSDSRSVSDDVSTNTET